MPIEEELLSKFERDWNEALEGYEARTKAARMGNVQYDPSSMTFAPQEPGREVTAGIRDEFFDPLESKWGLLLGRGRGSKQDETPERGRMFQTRDGVFEVDPFTGSPRQIIKNQEAAPRMADRDRIMLQTAARRLEGARRFASEARGSQKTAAANELAQAQDEFDALSQGSAARTPIETKADHPMVTPTTQSGSVGYIAGTFGENMFDPNVKPSGSVVSRPSPSPPPASSIKRFKWVDGQLQPAN